MSKNYLKLLLYLALLLIPGIIFFSATSPESLPVGLYILPFVYIFVVVYLTTRFLLTRLGARQQRYTRLLPNIIAILVTLVLLLGSLQQLSARDIVLMLAIGTLLTWYLHRLGSKE